MLGIGGIGGLMLERLRASEAPVPPYLASSAAPAGPRVAERSHYRASEARIILSASNRMRRNVVALQPGQPIG